MLVQRGIICRPSAKILREWGNLAHIKSGEANSERGGGGGGTPPGPPIIISATIYSFTIKLQLDVSLYNSSNISLCKLSDVT